MPLPLIPIAIGVVSGAVTYVAARRADKKMEERVESLIVYKKRGLFGRRCNKQKEGAS